MKKLRKLLLLAVFVLTSGIISAREVTRINENWKFILADDQNFSNPSFDDSKWRVLDVPHDWAFENGYSEDGAQGERGGYAGGGIGWYRKTINLSASDLKNRVINIDFDAVYMNSEVWINGEYMGKRPYGYISFSYDISKALKEGENVISVRVDNSLEPSARWYHGCGIYGNVYISNYGEKHFKKWSTFITTPDVTEDNAKVSIKSEIEGSVNDKLSVEYIIYNLKGQKIASKTVKSDELSNEINLKNPVLWSTENPYLYTLESKLYDGKKLIDSEKTRFGVRTIKWDAATGFWLNGENIKIYGVCEHLEGGPIGAAWNEKLLRWKLQIIKDMGVNTVRTSHNPQVPMFYDICDELGLMVVDEAFDGWLRKAPFDYGMQAFDQWWERDLRAMVQRDRNHPSIILYSLGNETHGDVAPDLVKTIKIDDTTRLITSGHSGSEFMDVLGVNGNSEKKTFFENYEVKDKAFIGTETPHTWQVRGYYRTKTWYRDGFPNKNQAPFEIDDLTEEEIFGYDWTAPENKSNRKQIFNSSYDNAMVRITARKNIELTRDLPWYSGYFRWTGFDYLGEAGYVHGGWPFRAFMGGTVDLAGFKKDLYYLYQSQWTSGVDMLHVLPHWTHPDMKLGTKIPVWAYTTGDEVELLLNGESLGRRKKGEAWNEMQCEWMVPWTPGKIEAVAYRNGKEIKRTTFETADAPHSLNISCEESQIKSGADNTAIVTFDIRDKKGVFHPFGENRIHLNIKGDAFVRSLESGNPVDVETNYKATSKTVFYGLLRAFIEAKGDKDVILTAGAICGDKSLKQSNEVAIDVKSITLRGKAQKANYEVFYTTDGSKASKESLKYTKPFAVKPNTKVKAVVYNNGELILTMEEGFGDGSGTYWGDPKDSKHFVNGELASKASCHNTKNVDEDGTTLVMPENDGFIEWYQENDGGEYTTKLSVTYMYVSLTEDAYLDLWVNDKFVKQLEFKAKDSRIFRDAFEDINIQRGGNYIKLKKVNGKAAPNVHFIKIY